jgi:hypothetical protein
MTLEQIIEEMERIARARELGQYNTLGADDLRRWAEALREHART